MTTRPMMSEVKMVFFFRCKKFTNAHEKIHSICEDSGAYFYTFYGKRVRHGTTLRANVFVVVQILGKRVRHGTNLRHLRLSRF